MVQAVGSVLLGIFIFNDVVKQDAINIVGMSVSLVVAGVGIAILAISEKLFTAK
jgi:hypothetical protein